MDAGSTKTVEPGVQISSVRLPAPTAWPFVMALGAVLILAGMVTFWIISALGGLLFVRAAIGWFREVFPHEKHETVKVRTEVVQVTTTRGEIAYAPLSHEHRAMLPLETYTIAAGVKGGIAGGVVMMILATLYGVVKYHSVWYAVNLLAAMLFAHWGNASTAFLCAFHPSGLVVGAGIHAVTCVLVGLLYGAMLPMFPMKPIFTAGFLGPLLWTGLLYSTMGIVNPVLAGRIDWVWFIVSQVAFGLVAGFVVNLHVKVRTHKWQSLPFAMRGGFATSVPGPDAEQDDAEQDDAEQDKGPKGKDRPK